MKFTNDHHQYMQLALQQANIAYQKGEVPVGCVIANSQQVISQAHNQVEELKNPLMHAEIIAINQACEITKNKFLEQFNIYTTLVPCAMCLQAIKQVRISKIFYAASDTKPHKTNPTSIEQYGGIKELEAKELFNKFFMQLRNKDIDS